MDREVCFYSGSVKIAGTFTFPNTDKEEKKPAIILSHGYGASRNEFGDFILLSKKLGEKGIASLRFDNRGCGTTDYPLGRMLCDVEWKEDLLNAINFVSSYPGIDPKRIGLIGESMGGANVLQTAAYENKSKCVIALSAIASGNDWVKDLWLTNKTNKEYEYFLSTLQEDKIINSVYGRSNLVKMKDALPYPQRYVELIEILKDRFESSEFTYYIELASINSILSLSPIKSIEDISSKHLILMAGKRDGIVPWEKNSKLLYEKAKCSKEIKLFGDGEHGLLAEPTKKEALDFILDSLEKYL